MPDLNKQTLINLLIDSPLREPIKINLIDIVNNTKDGDLSKTYSTIQKELEIYQKATNRRIKLADEINKKLGESPMQQTQNDQNPNPPVSNEPATPPTTSPTPEPTPSDTPSIETSASKTDKPVTDQKGPDLPPPTKLPPVNESNPDAPSTTPPAAPPAMPDPTQTPTTPPAAGDSAAPPPPPPSAPTPPTADDGAASDASEDEQALAEIQKELDTLKNSAVEDASATETPQPATAMPKPEVKPQK